LTDPQRPLNNNKVTLAVLGERLQQLQVGVLTIQVQNTQALARWQADHDRVVLLEAQVETLRHLRTESRLVDTVIALAAGYAALTGMGSIR